MGTNERMRHCCDALRQRDAAMPLFPPPPPPAEGDGAGVMQQLMPQGKAMLALALGAGRLLGVLNRKEARSRCADSTENTLRRV
jgi:hypothetical protein